MNTSSDELAYMIYILIDVECCRCQKRHCEPEGDTGSEIWSWAQRTAVAAASAGWRLYRDEILCPDCVPR